MVSRSWLMAQGPWLLPQGSWIQAYGSWAQAWETQRHIFLRFGTFHPVSELPRITSHTDGLVPNRIESIVRMVSFIKPCIASLGMRIRDGGMGVNDKQ